MSILAYHMVSPRFCWGLGRVTPALFDIQIKTALDAGYEFISLSEYIERYPQIRGCVTLTFDDGYDCIYEYALPILKKYRLTAAVFIMPAYAGMSNTWDVNWGGLLFNHLNWHQVKTLRDEGWEIGSHGYSHVDLSRLKERELEKEVTWSKQLLETKLDTDIRTISYPFGNCTEPVYRYCARAGYKAGLVMSRKPATVPDDFAMQRIGVYLTDFKHMFKAKLSSKYTTAFMGMQSILDFCSDGTVLVKQRLNLKIKS
ncbi:polysaccharide deacetylase family protein [candidate division KSB1 bacterium]|nr:polysaccharide deacetylase family protein [candidate division KSB1 bacterium]